MIRTREFELSIPTHIRFTLYKYDYIDRIIISRVLSECQTLNTVGDLSTVRSSDFIRALYGSTVLKNELEKINTNGFVNIGDSKPNSVHFIWTIIDRLINLEYISFKISYDKDFTRLYKTEDKEIHNFYYKILYGVFDLSHILNQDEIDEFNRVCIDFGLMKNNYLDRPSFLTMKADVLFEIIEALEVKGRLRSFNILNIDPKLDSDNPYLLVKTDYSVY